MREPARLAILGMGAMGQSCLEGLRERLPQTQFAFLEREHRIHRLSEETSAQGFSDVTELLDWQPDLVVECAGHSAVRDAVPEALRRGVDVVIASLGVLGDDQLKMTLDEAAESSGARLTVVSGAIGGLDALRAGMLAGVDSVVYEGRKPPSAWRGSAAEELCALAQLEHAKVFFEGSARAAAAQFPKNANVTAAVALAGVGFDSTVVRLIADPHAKENSHTVDVEGAFGRLRIVLTNHPLPQNPKTSWLAALSVQEAVLRRVEAIGF